MKVRKKYVLPWCCVLIILSFWPHNAFSGNLSSRISVISGYDTNAPLSPTRKGDIFEETLYSLDLRKPLARGLKFTFDYDLDVLNYNEYTDLSNILNHFGLGLHKKLTPFTIGVGYDLGIFYYTRNNDSDFLLQKGFLYARHEISKKLYHQLLFESGAKDYSKKKALGYTIDTYMNEERLDKRVGAEYSVAALLTPHLLARLRSKFILNDSNARYLNFYDYQAWQESLSVDYKLFKKLTLSSNITYMRKEYDERTVTLATYKQKDNFYAGTLGLLYRFNKNNSLSIYYTYRENSSNEVLEEYSQSMVSCGWQYNF